MNGLLLIYEWMGRWIDGLMDAGWWLDGWMDALMDAWKGEEMDDDDGKTAMTATTTTTVQHVFHRGKIGIHRWDEIYRPPITAIEEWHWNYNIDYAPPAAAIAPSSSESE